MARQWLKDMLLWLWIYRRWHVPLITISSSLGWGQIFPIFFTEQAEKWHNTRKDIQFMDCCPETHGSNTFAQWEHAILRLTWKTISSWKGFTKAKNLALVTWQDIIKPFLTWFEFSYLMVLKASCKNNNRHGYVSSLINNNCYYFSSYNWCDFINATTCDCVLQHCLVLKCVQIEWWTFVWWFMFVLSVQMTYLLHWAIVG